MLFMLDFVGELRWKITHILEPFLSADIRSSLYSMSPFTKRDVLCVNTRPLYSATFRTLRQTHFGQLCAYSMF